MPAILTPAARLAHGLCLSVLMARAVRAQAPANVNGGFEATAPGIVTDLAGVVAGWALETGAAVSDEFAVVSEGAHTGSRALRGTVNAAGRNDYDVQAIARPLPVTPGRTYVYTVWAKAAAAGATASFTVGNDAFMEYGRLDQQPLTTAWQTFTFEFTVTDQQTVIRAPLHFSFGSNVSNAVYIDELTIRAKGGVAAAPAAGEGALALEQNRPNPFGASTEIGYTLRAAGDVSLAVFNTLGQQVATLVDGPQSAGSHVAQLRAGSLAAGVYVYRLRVGQEVQTRRLVIAR